VSIIFLILPVTLLMCGGAVAAFAWATRSGQFDDLETPAIRLLHDDYSASAERCETDAPLSPPPIDPDRPPQ
jgi:cbb3-type cytochrome oxidase maturation protein